MWNILFQLIRWPLIYVLLGPFPLLNTTSAQIIWEKENYDISLNGKTLKIRHLKDGQYIDVVEITDFYFNFVSPDSIQVDSSNSDTVQLRLKFKESDGYYNDFPSELSLIISYKNKTFHFYAHHRCFKHVNIILKDRNEHYFGLIEKLYPRNSKNPDLRGNVVDVEVYGNGNEDYAENYASVYSAFFISSAGYGSFFNSFGKGRYHFGVNGITEIYHRTEKLDWYLFIGEDGKSIHREYFSVIGKPKYVPIWACGPIFWRDQNEGGKDEILNDIQMFTELKIPFTACWVDRPYSNGAQGWSRMDFSNKFSNPEEWIKIINEKYGLKFMTWVGPLTMSDRDFPGLLSNYRGYIDLTNPDAVKEFERRLSENQYRYGVKGHKMDRADQNFPVADIWYEKVSESEARNKYVFLYSKVVHEFLSRAHGKDHFNFSRAAFHRCQPYLSAVWGGDSRSNWYGMAGNMANAIRCGFMGFPIWGGDTGGYLGEGRIEEELYIRWLQWGLWNGLFEIKIDGAGGSGEDRPPWKYSKNLQMIFRDVCNWRMKLIPYIYSCANTSYDNGVLMKPLAYQYLKDEATYSIWDEYIFGDAFLVAPLFSKSSSRQIYLPEGKWYDLYNIENEYTGPVYITKNVPIDVIPVFVKSNSIYVTGEIYDGNSRLWKVRKKEEPELTIHLFPGKNNEETMFKYIDYFDNDSEKVMLMSNKSGYLIFNCEPLALNSIINLKCESKPHKILLNNNQINFTYNSKTKIATIQSAKSNKIELCVYFK